MPFNHATGLVYTEQEYENLKEEKLKLKEMLFKAIRTVGFYNSFSAGELWEEYKKFSETKEGVKS